MMWAAEHAEAPLNLRTLIFTARIKETGCNFLSTAGESNRFPDANYLMKPANPEELLKRVEKLLENKH